jgi:hypothetical protein
MQRFHLRKLNDAEVKEQYQVKISGVYVWKTLVIMWTSIKLGKILERT